MAIRYAPQNPPASISKHCTPPKLAARLVSLVPLSGGDTVLDPAAGPNRVFMRHFAVKRRLACEITTGVDFLKTPLTYDWGITNPPYHLLWPFIEKTAGEARKGFAFLVNINGLNSLTPRRLRWLRDRQFAMRHLHVCQVRKWFGRYYFFVFSKETRKGCILSWDNEVWD
jgi:hypothetical protein